MAYDPSLVLQAEVQGMGFLWVLELETAMERETQTHFSDSGDALRGQFLGLLVWELALWGAVWYNISV